MVNKVILVGRLGVDPSRPSENAPVKFSVATDRRYKDGSNEQKTETEWHNIVCWGKTGEFAEKYLKKGDMVFIEGRKKTESWDSKDGKRYRTDIVVQQLQSFSKSSGDAKPEEVVVSDNDDSVF